MGGPSRPRKGDQPGESGRARARDGAWLRTWEAGSGEELPVVLVHAFPLSARMWRPQIEELTDEFRLIAYDVRGFGGSEPGDGQYTMELYVDDLLAVLDGFTAAPAVVCGLSMGGYIALRALERAPDRFRAAILCDTRSAADDDAGKLGRAAAIARIKREGMGPWAREFVEGAFAPATLERNRVLVETTLDLILSNPPLGVCGAQLAMAARTDTTASLETLRVPALVLVGEEDGLTPPDTAQAMADRIPEAEVGIIPGAGHLANLENPEAFNSELRGFLRRIRSDAEERPPTESASEARRGDR